MAAKRNYEPKPLYRKVNSTAHGMKGRNHRYQDGGIKFERGIGDNDNKMKYKMKTGLQFHGLDYSPLYGFLRKNVGRKWDDVKSEALKRLPKESLYDQFISVIIDKDEVSEHYNYPVFCDSEASYHSILFVDEDGYLQYVNKEFTIDDIKLNCACCTHSFNGKRVNRKYKFK